MKRRLAFAVVLVVVFVLGAHVKSCADVCNGK